MSHLDIVTKFAQRKINKRTESVEWTGRHVYCKGDTIYSYGSHFPMARFLGMVNKKPFFLKNGDRYSDSTSRHQGMVNTKCIGPTISRRGLEAAGIGFNSIGLPRQRNISYAIIDFRPDFNKHVYQNRKTGKLYSDFDYETKKFSKEFSAKQGMFIPYSTRDDEPYLSGHWHILGACLLTDAKRNCYLCSLDEDSYFVSQLPKLVKTVEQAFQILKPKAVVQAEKEGLEVKRQGEWFFIPTGIKGYSGLADFFQLTSITAAKKLAIMQVLPRQSEQSNRHVCHQFKHENEPTLAFGSVRHWFAGSDQVTGQHRTLRLGEEWHECHKNTEIASWSASGKFD